MTGKPLWKFVDPRMDCSKSGIENCTNMHLPQQAEINLGESIFTAMLITKPDTIYGNICNGIVWVRVKIPVKQPTTEICDCLQVSTCKNP